MEAYQLAGKTLQEIALIHAIHPIQCEPVEEQMLEGASER